MIRATAKAPLTGITRLLSSSAEGVQIKESNREKLFVVVRTKADKVFLKAGVVAGKQPPPSLEVAEGKQPEVAEGRQPLPSEEVGEANQASPKGVEGTAHSEEASGAVT